MQTPPLQAPSLPSAVCLLLRVLTYRPSCCSPEPGGSENHLHSPGPVLRHPQFILLWVLSIPLCARDYAHKFWFPYTFCLPLPSQYLFFLSFFEIHHLGCQHFTLLGNTDTETIFTLESVNMCCQLFLWYRDSDKSWLLTGFQHVCLTPASSFSLPTPCQNQQPSAYIRCPRIFHLISIC